MKRRTLLVALGVGVAAVLAITPLAALGSGGTTVNPKATIIAERMNFTGPTSQAGTFSAAGALNDGGTATAEFSVTPTKRAEGRLIGTHTLTGSSGSTITIMVRGVVRSFPPPDPARVRTLGYWRIVRGTGKYANLTGDGRFHGVADFTNNTLTIIRTGFVTQGRDDLEAARTATVRYQSVAQAVADGYVAPPPDACVAHPTLGGMGYHYEHPARMEDNVVHPERPEMLVYERTANGEFRLIALEYYMEADQARTAPALFGRRFDGPMPAHHPGMETHYDLHVWLYKNNPSGLFAQWNPDVKCP